MTIEKLEPGFYRIGNHDISFNLNKKTWRWKITDLKTGESIEFSRTKCEAVIKFLDWLCDLSKKSSKFKEDNSDSNEFEDDPSDVLDSWFNFEA